MIVMRRLVEGLLEGPREMSGAETHRFGERNDRQGLVEMRLDLLVDDALLPCGKAATVVRVRSEIGAVEPCQLRDQHDAQRLDVISVGDRATLDFPRQLFCGGPQREVFEK